MLAYSNSFSGAFVLDDIPAIVENPHVRSLTPLRRAMDAPAETTVSGRPVVAFTLALNYALSPAPVNQASNPNAFHAGNLLIHILAGITLFGVIRRTLEVVSKPLAGGRERGAPPHPSAHRMRAGDPGPGAQGHSRGECTRPSTRWGCSRPGPAMVLKPSAGSDALQHRFEGSSRPLAAAIALLWILHPLQTASVTYIVQRAEALMGLFLLLTLYCAIRSYETRSRSWTVAAVIACALGMGAKEVMVVAPLLVIAWDWLFASERARSWREIVARRWPLYAGLAATWLILALNVWSEQRPGAVGFEFEGWPWWRYLATQAGVLLHYLGLSIAPAPLVLDYGWPAVQSLVAALPELIVVSTLVALTAFGLIKRHPASFAGVLFFLVLAPTSSVLPIVTEVAAEHRMYVPLASVIALIVIGLFEIGRRRRIPASAGFVAIAAVAVVLGWLTHARNVDYASEEHIWADTIQKRPDNPRARINYGVVLLAQGRTREAEPHLRTAVGLSPKDAGAQLALGAALCSTGRCDEGLVHLREAAALDSDNPNAVRNLAEALASRGNRREAAVYFRRAVELLPDDVFVLNQASWLLATEDDVRDGKAALAMAERAVRLTGGRDPVSLDSLAVACAELGRWEEARTAIHQAIAAAQEQPRSQLQAQLREHQQMIEAGRFVIRH